MTQINKELFSIRTGETIPDWLDLEGGESVEGIGSIVVREEDNGTWSVVRSVKGAEPEVDRGYPSKETAVRLAQAYNEGESIVIEERSHKQVRKAGIHPGMVAKYGEADVTITGVDGSDVRVLTPVGKEFYIDYEQLSGIKEAQEMTEAPPAEASPEAASGMMAGEGHEEVEEKLLEEWKELEEKEREEEEDLEEEEEKLLEELEKLEEMEGVSIGPPVVFVEIEPLPGERQSPLGADKKKKKAPPKDLKSLLRQIGIPVKALKETQQVKVSDVYLVHRENLPFGAYTLEGSPVPESISGEQMSRDDTKTALTKHYKLSEDLAESLINRATRGYETKIASRWGWVVTAQGVEKVEYESPDVPIQMRVVGTDTSGKPLFALFQGGEGNLITSPLPEADFIDQLVDLLPGISENPERLTQQLHYAKEYGATPVVAELRVGTCPFYEMLEKKKKKKNKDTMVPREHVSSLSPAIAEVMEKNGIQGIRLGKLLEVLRGARTEVAKQAPTCKKCGKPHWPFVKCEDVGKKKEEEKVPKKEAGSHTRIAVTGPKGVEVGYFQAAGGRDEFEVFAPGVPGKMVLSEDEARSSLGDLGLSDFEADNLIRDAREEWTEWYRQHLEESPVAPGGIPPEAVAKVSSVKAARELETRKKEGWYPGCKTVEKTKAGPGKKQPPTCKKCGKPHWPFQKCPTGKEEKVEKQELEEAECGPDGMMEKVEMRRTGDVHYDVMSDTFEVSTPTGTQSGLTYEEALERLRTEVPETGEENVRWTLDQAKGQEKAPEVTEAQPIAMGGKVRMTFDWGEFFTDVIPQLSNHQFESVFEDSLNTPPDVTASQEEKDFYNEEVLLFQREASRRNLPDPSSITYGIGDRVARIIDSKILGEVKEYRKGRGNGKIDCLVSLASGSELWFSESELKPILTKTAKDLQPTSNPDTTTVPWTERSRKITDPENVKQKKEFAEDLRQKTGQVEGAITDKEAREVAEKLVDRLVSKQDIQAVVSKHPDIKGSDLVDDYKRSIETVLEKEFPGIYGNDLSYDLVMRQAGDYIQTELLPSYRGKPGVEDEDLLMEMKVGSLVKIASNYKTDTKRVQKIRDQDLVGTVLELNERDAAANFEGDVLLIRQENLGVVEADFFRGGTIRKCKPGDKDLKRPASEQEWCLYSKSTGRVLGRHPTHDNALNQEKAIKAQGVAIMGELSNPSKKVACDMYTYADSLVKRVQMGKITAPDAQKELNSEAKKWGWDAAAKKYVKNRLEGKVASSSILAKLPFDAGRSPAQPRVSGGGEKAREIHIGVKKQLALHYNTDSQSYCLYDLDFGPVSTRTAKEKDIRGQLKAFRVPDAQIVDALKEAKKGEVLIRVGIDIGECIKSAVDFAITQLGPQATRGQLMMTAMQEMAKATDDVTAQAYQKQIKNVLSEVLEDYPREEYDGHREFPQRGLTVPAAKEAHTYEGSEKRRRIDQFKEHGIPLVLLFEQKTGPISVPPDKQLSAVAHVIDEPFPFKIGDEVKDKIHGDLTGTVIGFSGDSFVQVAMNETKYCEAGSESLYLADGLISTAQELEFEDAKKLERKKRLLRSLLPEREHELFWKEPEKGLL